MQYRNEADARDLAIWERENAHLIEDSNDYLYEVFGGDAVAIAEEEDSFYAYLDGLLEQAAAAKPLVASYIIDQFDAEVA